jgi:threonine dehydratase
MQGKIPSFADISRAHRRIFSFIHHTPVVTSSLLNEITGAELFFKCENFQKTGAFKYRGATHAVLRLKESENAREVATHSSGNHAGALAHAAWRHGLKAYIVMPKNSRKVKIAAVRSYGAEIFFCEPNLQARESMLEAVRKDSGTHFVHPYNDPLVIAGQGTVAMELLEEVEGLDIVIAPVGGGGLLSGTALSAKALKKDIVVIGAEPAQADDAKRSFDARTLVPSVNPDTIADGLLTSLGSTTFAIILDKVDGIYTASEQNIIMATRLVWERLKILIEPSAALPLAVLLQHPGVFNGKRLGLILSGGNVDLDELPF